MSRSTQFVGLTDAAGAFAGSLEATGRYVGAHGMFGEDIELGRWRDADGNEYREVVQADPWSSGPCIFTCLEMRFANEGEDGEPDRPSRDEAMRELRDSLEQGTRVSGTTAVYDHGHLGRLLSLLDVLEQAPDPTRLFEWALDPTLKAEHREWDGSRGAYWI